MSIYITNNYYFYLVSYVVTATVMNIYIYTDTHMYIDIILSLILTNCNVNMLEFTFSL